MRVLLIFIIIIGVVYMIKWNDSICDNFYLEIITLLNDTPGNSLQIGYEPKLSRILTEFGRFKKELALLSTEENTNYNVTLRNMWYGMRKRKSDQAWNSIIASMPFYGVCILAREPNVRDYKTIYKMRKNASVLVFQVHHLNLLYRSYLKRLVAAYKYHYEQRQGFYTLYILSNSFNPCSLYGSCDS